MIAYVSNVLLYRLDFIHMLDLRTIHICQISKRLQNHSATKSVWHLNKVSLSHISICWWFLH